MKEERNVTPSAMPDESDSDLVSLLQSMQQQLIQLEKKVDMLISRSQGRSSQERPPQGRSFDRRSFSKSFRSPHHDKREREYSPRDRESVPGHFYERRPQEKSRRPNPRKKPFAFKRDEGE